MSDFERARAIDRSRDARRDPRREVRDRRAIDAARFDRRARDRSIAVAIARRRVGATLARDDDARGVDATRAMATIARRVARAAWTRGARFATATATTTATTTTTTAARAIATTAEAARGTTARWTLDRGARWRTLASDASTRAATVGGGEGGTRAREADATADGRDDDDDARARVDAGVMRVRWTIAEGQGRGEDAVVPVYSFDGEARGSVELPGRIFDQPLRVDVAHRVVRWQRAKARKGLHKTKSRGEVAGSTRKVRPQKGSGRARVGNLKAPQMRGGGTAHGPVVRSHAHALPKKVRRMGLKVALSAKAAEGKLIVVDSFAGMEPKTRAMKATLERLTGDLGLAAGGEFHSTLIIDGEFEEMAESVVDAEDQFGPSELVRMSARNLPHVEVLPQIGANVYSILRRRTLIVTKSGLEQLIARLDAPIKR
jgi:large subunit ribosomal protein L4